MSLSNKEEKLRVSPTRPILGIYSPGLVIFVLGDWQRLGPTLLTVQFVCMDTLAFQVNDYLTDCRASLGEEKYVNDKSMIAKYKQRL